MEVLETDMPRRRRCKQDKACRRLEKGSFFSSRFMTSNLPSPPRSPPSQFFPAFGEEQCPTKTEKESRRRKPCKKKENESDIKKEKPERKKRSKNDSELDGSEGKKKGKRSTITSKEGKDEKKLEGDDVGDDNDDLMRGDEEEDDESKNKRGEGEDYGQGKGHDRGALKKKKKCKKPVCKKKVSSDFAASLLTREIPCRQRELPETSPKNMPEVQRQIQQYKKDAQECPEKRTKCGKIIKVNKKKDVNNLKLSSLQN